MKPKAIGIDLGTTYSAVAYLERGRPVIIPNAEGGSLTPSVVGFLRDGSRLVGQLARLQAVANPDGTIFSIKRRMGRRNYLDFDGASDDQEIIRQIKRRMGSDFWVRIGEREYTPEEISAMILRKVKADAESYLGEKVEKAVISVPAYFNVSQRQATVDAAAIAGIEALRIIDEPTAAALAYGLDIEDVHTVLVWDLGGGTFDVSILELGDGLFEVKAVNGNTWLGGDDYDQRIVEHLADEFRWQRGVDLREDKSALQRLKEAAEAAKIQLSDTESTRIRIPYLNASDGNPQHWETTLSRAKFEELTEDLQQKMTGPTKQALADAGLQPRDIDRVILVGGSTRMPAVRELLRELLDKEPYGDIHPDEAVAMGAAIQAGILTGEIQGKVLINVTPLSLGIETQGGIFTRIIRRNTAVPVSHGQVFTNAADGQTSTDIHVLQGEREMAINNMTLDRFELAGMPAAPRGEARVEVTFDIDVNGILHVSAHDLYSDSSHKLRISPRFYGLSSEEMGRMIEEAQRYAEEDQRRREEVEAGIKADNMVRAARQVIEEVEDDADPLLADEIERGILQVQAAVASGYSEELRTRTEELEKLVKALHREAKAVTRGQERLAYVERGAGR
ncbi:MAG: molecular chaperone DnaK [Dehalococcoidia bacterium]|nr:molecular chaperone DnaK [Dehalococcoidia bacterium]